jgi:hypothetical protein
MNAVNGIDVALKPNSVISSLMWSKKNKGTLAVFFKRGTVYQYNRVPARVLSALLNAKSIGRTFNREVRDKFTGYQVE